mmetsp:Transcript_23436/g.46840  ORF Transcript_23436/g.46840 Transcript_23436/m.46840 type:complete len:190 (+) Transcript_23436:563-1132(+)
MSEATVASAIAKTRPDPAGTSGAARGTSLRTTSSTIVHRQSNPAKACLIGGADGGILRRPKRCSLGDDEGGVCSNTSRGGAGGGIASNTCTDDGGGVCNLLAAFSPAPKREVGCAIDCNGAIELGSESVEGRDASDDMGGGGSAIERGADNACEGDGESSEERGEPDEESESGEGNVKDEDCTGGGGED